MTGQGAQASPANTRCHNYRPSAGRQPLPQGHPIHGACVQLRTSIEHREPVQRLAQCRQEVIAIQIVALHVQAYLQVPSYFAGEVMDAKYGPGERVLLRETWDNAGGENYRLPIAQE
jgi:hypothetical protein